MKKLTAFILALACALVPAGCSAIGVKPYKNLTAEDISFASVRLSPPDKTIQIENTDELAELLQDAVIYQEDPSYTEYAGQGVTFALTMADGTQTTVMAYNPFLVIDGVGHRTAYEPCEALNEYANRLLNDETLTVILEEPPALTVVSDETTFDTVLGGYAWQKKNSDGTSAEVEADHAHPLDCKDLLPSFETTEETATLRFLEEPDSILSVCCWSDAHWSDPTANSAPVTVRGNTIELKPGGYIYEVTAQWDAGSGYGGTAHYSFYILLTA